MIRTIDEALDKIYSYVDYSMTHAKNVDKNVFTLENIQKFLEKRGNPQNTYPIIHVAGTKGKGSVCAMLASALQNTGFRTGLYTSPHLMHFNERITVNGEMISDDAVIDLTNRLESSLAENDRISSFEFMTAMAFEYFRDQRVDIAIVETGLGGRLDATNVVTPILSVITSISLDHTDYLGDTAEKIAGEKAGIIKAGVPVICARQVWPEAEKKIRESAAKQKAPWIYVPDRYRFINLRGTGADEYMQIWRVEDQKLMENKARNGGKSEWQPTEIHLPLKGLHQMENGAVVYAALNKLKARFSHLDFGKALAGVEQTFWPCRFEQLDPDGYLTVDGAHNADSVEKLAVLIDRCFGCRKVKCIFGASGDKDLAKMISVLAPHIDEFIMTRSVHPRAADPAMLSVLASRTGRENRVTSSLEEAYNIYKTEKEEGVCFVAAGSLFVAGGIRQIYMEEHPETRDFACSKS